MSKKRFLPLALFLALGIFLAVAGTSLALSPAATNGHLTITKGSGVPTGVPALTNSDQAADFFDVSSSTFYGYNAGWKRLSGNYTLASKQTAVTIASSSAAIRLFTWSIPASAIGATNRLNLSVRGTLNTKGSAPGTYAAVLSYGGNTFTVASGTLNAAGLTKPFSLDVAIVASTTAAQEVLGTFADGTGSAAPALTRGSVATDSTTAQDLYLTWQFGTADNNNILVSESAYLALVRGN